MDLINENYPSQTCENGWLSLLALPNFLPKANQKDCLEDVNAVHNELQDDFLVCHRVGILSWYFQRVEGIH